MSASIGMGDVMVNVTILAVDFLIFLYLSICTTQGKPDMVVAQNPGRMTRMIDQPYLKDS